MTVKQAFSCLGLHNVAMRDTPFKELDEEIVFAGIMHWTVHKMKKGTSVMLRFRVEDKVYQVKIKYVKRHLRIKKN